MNRFQKKKNWMQSTGKVTMGLLLMLILGLFWAGIGSVSKETQEQQKKSLENAIWRDVVHCYAMEGKYPESLEYMEQHYGLSYDKNRFFVDYEIVGSNVMPDVTVIEQR